jgi:D-amino-acid dehydrogenase
MKITILGAGIIGVCTAWHLLERGHEVTVVDRQAGPAMETSFANAAQISVGYCEPWANRDAPQKILRWMLSQEAPLLFRPQWPWGEGLQQWLWAGRFLMECNDRAYARNVAQLAALGSYSHAALKEIVASTGISYHRLEKGIAHFFLDQGALDAAASAAGLMARYGIVREVVDRSRLLQIEPALQQYADHIVGATYTATDESGDARMFTEALARRCAAGGVRFLWGHDVLDLQLHDGHVEAVKVYCRDDATVHRLLADQFVLAMGSYTAGLLRSVGIRLPIYPGKGYSATLRILRPELAPQVSLIDDSVKCAMTRLGDTLRVAGTIEVGGYDLSLQTPLAQARCAMLLRRVEAVLPGVCDTRAADLGGDPKFWTGLRPATPTNLPYIGKTRLRKLWVNAGHGTLGWTHGAGSGKALAELMSGQTPDLAFRFYGI